MELFHVAEVFKFFLTSSKEKIQVIAFCLGIKSNLQKSHKSQYVVNNGDIYFPFKAIVELTKW